jgi:hypothetical protein
MKKSRRLLSQMKISGLGVLAAVLLPSCGDGKIEESDPVQAFEAARVGASAGAGNGEKIEFKFPSRMAPADIVFMVEADGSHRDQNNIIGKKLVTALEGFNARWRFMKSDIRVGVAPLSIPDRDQSGKRMKATQLDKGFGLYFAGGEPGFLTQEVVDYDKTLLKRIFMTNDESWMRSPYGAPVRYLTAAKEAKEIRAFTSFIMISSAPDEGEDRQPEAIVKELDALTDGKWNLTVIGLPDGGCSLGDKLPFIGKNDAAKPDDQKFVYLSEKLAKAAGAKANFVSMCADSFGETLQNVLLGTGLPARVEVPLAFDPLLSSITVSSKEGKVKGWQYSKETKSLVLPNFIAGGTQLTIEYKKFVGTGANKAPDLLKSPAIVATKLTPEVVKFLADANPILEANCSGCHAPGGDRTRYVGSYENVLKAADLIKARIALPDANAQKMPMGRTLSPADKTKLDTYLDSLPK